MPTPASEKIPHRTIKQIGSRLNKQQTWSDPALGRPQVHGSRGLEFSLTPVFCSVDSANEDRNVELGDAHCTLDATTRVRATLPSVARVALRLVSSRPLYQSRRSRGAS